MALTAAATGAACLALKSFPGRNECTGTNVNPTREGPSSTRGGRRHRSWHQQQINGGRCWRDKIAGLERWQEPESACKEKTLKRTCFGVVAQHADSSKFGGSINSHDPVVSKRLVLMSLMPLPLVSNLLMQNPARAEEAEKPAQLRAFGKYIKKKKLDPLDTYVPTVLLTRQQLLLLQEAVQDPAISAADLADIRKLLRSGPASSLRNDLRAIAQYAADQSQGLGQEASAAVEKCLDSIVRLDGLFIKAARSGEGFDAFRAEILAQVEETLGFLGDVLKTVPADVFEKSERVANSYLQNTVRESEEATGEQQQVDAEGNEDNRLRISGISQDTLEKLF